LSRYSLTGDIANYPVKDSSGLFARPVLIYDLFVEGDRIWMGHDLGVSKFLIYSNGGEIKDTGRKLGDIFDDEDVVSVAVIDGNLWAGTSRGLAFIDSDNENIQFFGNWRSFMEGENGLVNADVRSIASYQGKVMIGTANGVFGLTVSPDTLWESTGLSGLIINRLLDTDSTLLAATTGGIYSYDGANWSTIPSDSLPGTDISDLALDQSGRLWAGTRSSGLAGFSGSFWETYSIPGPASNFIRDIVIDSTGTIWMTHDQQGYSRLDDTVWTVYNSDNSGLEDNGAFSTTVDAEGNIWSGSYGGGLYLYDHTSWYHWSVANSPMWGVPGNLNYWAATAVQVDDGGNVWVSSLDSDSGLIMGVFNPPDSIWQLYLTGPNTVSENRVEALMVQGNTIWVGMHEALHRLRFGGTPFDESDDNWDTEIIGEFVVDMALDRFGDLWFGSLTGLFTVSSGTAVARRVDLPPELAGRVNTVAVDGIGNIWIGAVTGMAVLRPDANEWRSIYTTTNSPLVNNEVTEIAIDVETGMVYIGTVGGLSIFDSGFEAPSEDLSDVEAYPNPVNVEAGHNSLFFKRIPADANVYIYTVAGDLVAEFRGDRWDLLNGKGEPVAGGIYVFLVESGGVTGTGKFAVIK
jgi:ligand-binding sensor domain-containing protein